jgi:general secretion pathway protein M
MKLWWQQLALREKQMVGGGSFLLGIFLFYQIFFVILDDGVSHLRQKIQTQQTLLAWMLNTNAHILALQKNPAASQPTHHSSAALLGIIQDSINNSPIAANISQLQQAENEAVELHLQKVNFDALTAWLVIICQLQQLTITQMSVTPSVAGIVDADLKLAYS